MFAIYNNNGLSFRSTIDNLYSLSNIDSIARARNNVTEGLPKDHSVKEKNKKKLYDNSSLNEAEDVYKKIANIDTSSQIFHVKDIMTKDVLTLNETNTVQEAYDIMDDENIRQIPLLDSNNQIIALVTQKTVLDLVLKDLAYADYNLKKNLASLDFDEVLTADPITDIRRIAKVMVDFSLTAVPVVDQDDKLQGIVSRSNVLKAVANTPPMQIWG